MPLTDLHVGSGETAIPGEYFVFDGDLNAYFIDLGQATTKIPKLREFVAKILEKPGWEKAIRTPPFQQYVTKYSRFQRYLARMPLIFTRNGGCERLPLRLTCCRELSPALSYPELN